MLSNILIVALREFRQITGTRSFWVTLLILPIAFAIGPLAGRMLELDRVQQVMVVDGNGREAAAVRARFAMDHERDVLTALSRYAQRFGLNRARPSAVWARHDRLYGDEEVAAFEREGGLAQALRDMEPVLPKDVPAFDAPKPRFSIVPTPAAVASAEPTELDGLLKPLLLPSVAGERQPVDYVVYIPSGFGSTTRGVRLWSSGKLEDRFVQPIESVLAARLRSSYVERLGLSGARPPPPRTLPRTFPSPCLRRVADASGLSPARWFRC